VLEFQRFSQHHATLDFQWFYGGAGQGVGLGRCFVITCFLQKCNKPQSHPKATPKTTPKTPKKSLKCLIFNGLAFYAFFVHPLCKLDGLLKTYDNKTNPRINSLIFNALQTSLKRLIFNSFTHLLVLGGCQANKQGFGLVWVLSKIDKQRFGAWCCARIRCGFPLDKAFL